MLKATNPNYPNCPELNIMSTVFTSEKMSEGITEFVEITLNLAIEPHFRESSLAGGNIPNQKDYPIRDIRPILKYIKSLSPETFRRALSVVGDNGRSPLRMAALIGSSDTIKALLEYGACLDDPELFGFAVRYPNSLEILCEAGLKIPEGYSFVDTDNEFCLEINEILLRFGADPNAADSKGLTLCTKYLAGYPKMARVAIEYGADVHQITSSGDSLVGALCGDDTESLDSKFMLAEIAHASDLTDLYHENEDHQTPMEIAIETENAYAIPILIHAGVDPRQQNSLGESVVDRWDEIPKNIQTIIMSCVPDLFDEEVEE